MRRLRNASGMIDRIDGAHVIAVAMLFLAAVGGADSEGGSKQRRFDVVNGERVAGQQCVDPSAANQLGKRGAAAGVDHDRPGDRDDSLTFGTRLS